MKSMSEQKRLFVVISVMAATVLIMVTLTAVILYNKAVSQYEVLLSKGLKEKQVLLQQVEKRLETREVGAAVDEETSSRSFVELVKNMTIATADKQSIADVWVYQENAEQRVTLLTIKPSETGRHQPRISQGGVIPEPDWARSIVDKPSVAQWEASDALFAKVIIALPNDSSSAYRHLVIIKRIELRRLRLPFINTFFLMFLTAQFFIWAGSSLIGFQINPLIKYLDEQVIFNQTILNTAPIPIITSDENDNITAANRATLDVFSHKFNALKGLSIHTLFHVDKDKSDYEAQGVSGCGRGLALNISQGTAMINDKLMHVYLAQDITQIKETEESLRDATEHMAVVVESVNDGVITCNMQGNIISVNPAAEAIFDRKQEKLIGAQICHFIEPAPTLDEPCFRMEVSVKRPNLQKIPVEVSCRQYQHHDQKHFSCVLRDITERKAADTRLKQQQSELQATVDNRTSEVKALVETAVVGVVSIDQHGRILSFNPAAEAMFGYKAEEILHQNVSILIPLIHSDQHDKFIQRYLKTREPRIIGRKNEVAALRKDGSHFEAMLSVGHKELSNSNHLFVAHILDVTEAKRTEAELIEAKERAEAAARVKANFLANMSHEIRTPMNAIIGFSEVLSLNSSLDPVAQQQVETIRASGQSLLTVLNDILDFSKFEAGKVNIEHVGFNLANLVRDCVDVMRIKADSKRLVLNLLLNFPEPYRVVGDPNRIRQVLINLLGNAIKFTNYGHVEVVVSQQEGETEVIEFLVKDTGIGMSETQLSHVFESFSQADSSTTRRFGGTGLGTAISRQIIETMEGKIWATSEENVGSTFGFSLLLPTCFDNTNCLYESSTSCPVVETPRCFSVLMAEDIIENAKLVEFRLTHLGHKLTWVKNGLEALEALERSAFDLILMDIMMPQLDGLEATRRIRQSQSDYADIPIVALTASVMQEEQSRCFEAGMNAVEHKPINFNSLLATMDKVVTNQSTLLSSSNTSPSVAVSSSQRLATLQGIVNVEQALQMWLDADKYIESLIYYIDSAEENVGALITAVEQDVFDVAAKKIHAIKGAVGNLYLTSLYELSQQLEQAIDEKDKACCLPLLSQMQQEINTLKESLSSLTANKITTGKQQIIVDTAILLAQLHDLLDSLHQCNPDKSLPFVQNLAKLLSYDDIQSLELSLEDFDFEKTREIVFSIAYRYQLILEDS